MGNGKIAAADCTPGRTFSFWVRSRKKTAFFRSGNFASGKSTLAVITLCGSKPGFTSCSRIRLRISNPALASRTNASAISTITSELRSPCRLRPAVVFSELSFNASTIFERVTCSAGARPNNIPVSSDNPAVNTSTHRSM